MWVSWSSGCARLLQRTTRSVTLTDAGELPAPQPADAGADGERGRRNHHRTDACVASCASPAACRLPMPNWRRRWGFLALHPQLKIDLNASEGALNLVEARIDLAIRISAEPDPMLIGRRWRRATSVLVASPAYLAAARVPQVSRSTWPAPLPELRQLWQKCVELSEAKHNPGERGQPLQRQRGHRALLRGRWRVVASRCSPPTWLTRIFWMAVCTRAAGLEAAGYGDLRAVPVAQTFVARGAGFAGFSGRAVRQEPSGLEPMCASTAKNVSLSLATLLQALPPF
jgi:DNA-binding transcriptional LysR family regulator